MTDLTPKQRQRYARHLALDEIGNEGQGRLLRGRVLIVGAGGLGSPAALYLAAAGVGSLVLVDADTLDLSNLQRQILYRTPEVGAVKVGAAREALMALNPDVTVTAIPERLTQHNATTIISEADFVIDATDNLQSKALINATCVATGTPFSHGGILQFLGQTFTILPGRSACVRCVFGDFPGPRASDEIERPSGPIGAVPGVIGTIQATEALKFLLGIGELLAGRLLIYSALETTFRTVALRRQPSCPVCGPIAAEPAATKV